MMEEIMFSWAHCTIDYQSLENGWVFENYSNYSWLWNLIPAKAHLTPQPSPTFTEPCQVFSCLAVPDHSLDFGPLQAGARKIDRAMGGTSQTITRYNFHVCILFLAKNLSELKFLHVCHSKPLPLNLSALFGDLLSDCFAAFDKFVLDRDYHQLSGDICDVYITRENTVTFMRVINHVSLWFIFQNIFFHQQLQYHFVNPVHIVSNFLEDGIKLPSGTTCIGPHFIPPII